jgi:PAS domain S-box-containing protein
MGKRPQAVIETLRRRAGRRSPTPAHLTRLRHLGIWAPTAFGALLLALTLGLYHVLPLGMLVLLILGASAAGAAAFSWFIFSQIQEREEEIVHRTQELEGLSHALAAAVAHNERILQAAGEGIYGQDAQGNTTFVNPAAARMIGWEAKNLIGKPMHEILHHTRADGTRYSPEECPIYAALRDGTIHHSVKDVFWRKDGTSFAVEYTSTPIWEGSRVVGAVVTFKDITERKDAEEALRVAHADLEQRVNERTETLAQVVRTLEDEIGERKRTEAALTENREHFRRLVETANVIPWEADATTWRFTYVGPQASRILGFPLDAWFEDGFWVNQIYPEDRETAVNFCRQASETMPDYEFEYRMYASDGRVVWMRDIVTVVGNEGGAKMLRGFMLDITEHRHVEEQLRRSQEQLRSLSGHLITVQEEERARIAREIHDELGQALTAIKLDLAWLAKHLPPGVETLHTKLQALAVLTDRTTQSVRRLATELRPGVLDHLGLVAALDWLVREFQERTGLTCHLRCTPAEIALDPERATAVFRICQEALTNVARHAKARAATIRLTRSGAGLSFEIEDDGRGIPAAAVADPKSIGLMGMRERVLPWGGQVEIQGKPRQGTLIRVTLPLDASDAGPQGDGS